MWKRDPSQTRQVDNPQPGLFRFWLTRGAWGVPARILYEDGLWSAEVNETPQPPDPDPERAPYVSDIWNHGQRIDQVTYDHLIDVKHQALAHGPANHPALWPTTRIQPVDLPPIPFPQQRNKP